MSISSGFRCMFQGCKFIPMDAPADERERQRLLCDPLCCFIVVPGDGVFICKFCCGINRYETKTHLQSCLKTPRFVCEGCKGELKDCHSRKSAAKWLYDHKKICIKYQEYSARSAVPRDGAGDSNNADGAEGADDCNGDEDGASEKTVMNDHSEGKGGNDRNGLSTGGNAICEKGVRNNSEVNEYSRTDCNGGSDYEDSVDSRDSDSSGNNSDDDDIDDDNIDYGIVLMTLVMMTMAPVATAMMPVTMHAQVARLSR